MRFSTVFIMITLLISMVDIWIAYYAYKKKNYEGRYLSMTCIASSMVALTYLVSVLPLSRFWVSMASSLYFIGVDITLICLLPFVHSFTQRADSNKASDYKFRILMQVVRIYGAVEAFLFLINPFYEIVVGYVHRGGMDFACYEYEMYPLYYQHLVFSYLMIAYVLFRFLDKMRKAPWEYRNEYMYTVISIAVVIAVNAIFLYLPDYGLVSRLDYSIWGYSLIALILYWSCFVYSQNGMLLRIKNSIFENIDQGIVIFDYGNNLVLKNHKAMALLTGIELEDTVRLESFLENCRIRLSRERMKEDHSMQCYFSDEHGEERAVRCDYKVLWNRRNQNVGKMFVFTDMALEMDMLTEFHNLRSFKRLAEEKPELFQRPMVVAVCDINRLSVLNTTMGRNAGDQAIQNLAKELRNGFPGDSYFVRGDEADLYVLMYDRTLEEARAYLESIQEKHNIQFALAVSGADDVNVLSAINAAFEAMREKKMMDKGSAHSALLTALVKALKETDADTEAHVLRTQRMGELLGKRIGLSDIQQSDLNLLCVLHDIGKIGIPLEILNKPGRLSRTEWQMMKEHVEKGYQIAMSSPELNRIADMVRCHHERWDGQGYPDGLSKESIPLLSRVISIVDSYDAMISPRPYKTNKTKAEALEEIRRCAGTQFDPYIASEFIQMMQENNQEEMIPAKRNMMEEKNTDENERAMSQEAEEADPVVVPMHYSRYILDSNMRIVQTDDNFEKITGYSETDVVREQLVQADLVPQEDRTEYLYKVGGFLSEGNVAYLEHRLQKKDGSIVYVFCLGRKYFDAAVKDMYSEIMVADVMDTRAVRMMMGKVHDKAQNQLRHWEDMYRKDSLTGLRTHAAFKSDVEDIILRQKKRILFMMMDLDHFKQYNDAFGHRDGDELLIIVAQTLEEVMGEDDLPCRMGGDEFAAALVLGETEQDQEIYERAKHIFERMSRVLKATKGDVGISIGTALSGAELDTFNKLYSAADRALYRAKSEGRNRISRS